MRVWVAVLGLAAAPLRAAQPSPLDRAVSVLPRGLYLPSAPDSAAGSSIEPGVWIEKAVPLRSAGPDVQAQAPVTVDIKDLLNRHWTTAESMGEGPDKLYLSGQMDLEGNPYLAVFASYWPSPRFIPIKRGMAGTWSVNNSEYNVSLSVSIFRKKLNNFIVIEKTGSGKAYQIRIAELFSATSKAGQDVSIGGQTYRLFYSNNVDPSKDPMVMDADNFGFCFVHDKFENGEHDFKFYLLSRKDIAGPAPVPYKMFDDRVFKFRVTDDLSTLEISR